VILGEHGVSAAVLQNNVSQYYQLYHPGTPDESISVRNIVNSSVQRAWEKGVTCVKVDFFYHVKVIISGEEQSSCIIMRCNPVWNTTETMHSNQNKIKNKKNGLTGLKLIGMTIMAMCTLSPLHLIYWGGQILYSD
jgi:diaminopimelate decarboxylase